MHRERDSSGAIQVVLGAVAGEYQMKNVGIPLHDSGILSCIPTSITISQSHLVISTRTFASSLRFQWYMARIHGYSTR